MYTAITCSLTCIIQDVRALRGRGGLHGTSNIVLLWIGFGSSICFVPMNIPPKGASI